MSRLVIVLLVLAPLMGLAQQSTTTATESQGGDVSDWRVTLGVGSFFGVFYNDWVWVPTLVFGTEYKDRLDLSLSIGANRNLQSNNELILPPPSGRKISLTLGYAQIDARYAFWHRHRFHPFVGLGVGGGLTAWAYEESPIDNEYYDQDFAWLVTPEVGVEFDAAKVLKVSVFGGYMGVFDNDLAPVAGGGDFHTPYVGLRVVVSVPI